MGPTVPTLAVATERAETLAGAHATLDRAPMNLHGQRTTARFAHVRKGKLGVIWRRATTKHTRRRNARWLAHATAKQENVSAFQDTKVKRVSVRFAPTIAMDVVVASRKRS
jgi:hypothetical protein